MSALALLFAVPVKAQFDLDKLLQRGTQMLGGSSGAAAALGNDEIVAGLKEALAQGAQRSVSSLGRADGFLGNARVRIPLPEKLQMVESGLRAVGQGHYADEFITTMNRAAESAVPEASAILGDAIREMTVPQAKQILTGPDDAATRYFRDVGGERLAMQMRPIVGEATGRAGVTAAYKNMVAKAGPAATLMNLDALDIDRYVTDKALDGLFSLIADEEKRIRDDPVARGTDLLKKVFGSSGN